MSNIKVNVKWGKQMFKNVEVNQNEPFEVLQAQLFALSGVFPERQKIMVKGKTLKVDSWIDIKLKEGVTLLMMGSVEALPDVPTEKTQFIEDMTDAQVATASNHTAGLTNLGNTCYMNATIQCLRNVPELLENLLRHSGQLNVGSMVTDPSNAVTISLRDLYKMMEKVSGGLPPIMFLQVLHSVFPQFAEKTEQGIYQQQDANECWMLIIKMLQQKLQSGNSSLIDRFFGIDFKSSMKCDEAEDEEEKISYDKNYQLSCFISQDVKYLHTGLKSRITEKIIKASPSLGRDASYTRTSLINRLPAYLTIQFVRFFYKEKEKVNAKILKDIKFPLNLDVIELCSPELQQKLAPMRKLFKDNDDKNSQKLTTNKSTAKVKKIPFHFDDDPGSNNSGYYELTAVLTHRGRSSSSGHYVAWVRQKADAWLMFDDDNVVPVTSEDVLKLSGGGDWHCAYVLLYAPKQLEVEEEQQS